MAFSRNEIQSHLVTVDDNGAVGAVAEFYFPRGARIKRYFAVPTVAQAAHSTIVVEIVFTNAALDGSGSTTLATLTNDSDTADTTKIQSAAWVAHDALEINTEDRPGSPTAAENAADLIAAGSVIKAVMTGAGTTPSAQQILIGVEYVEST